MKGLFDDTDDLSFNELDTASSIFDEKEPDPEPIDFAWAWLAKYRVPYQDPKESFSGIYYHNLTHTGFYSPTGAGKTFLRNTIIEVSLWAHDQNIVISDGYRNILLPRDRQRLQSKLRQEIMRLMGGNVTEKEIKAVIFDTFQIGD